MATQPKFSSEQRRAVIELITTNRLTGEQASALAAAGAIPGLDAFDISPNHARALANAERTSNPQDRHDWKQTAEEILLEDLRRLKQMQDRDEKALVSKHLPSIIRAAHELDGGQPKRRAQDDSDPSKPESTRRHPALEEILNGAGTADNDQAANGNTGDEAGSSPDASAESSARTHAREGGEAG